MSRRVLIVGPIVDTYGGVARFQQDLLEAELPFDLEHFNTARPPKLRTRPIHRYDELWSAGPKRALLGMAITARNLVRFPLRLLRRRPAVVHVTGPTYWPFWEAVLYLLVARALRVPVLFHVLVPFDAFYQPSPGVVRGLVRTCLRTASQVVCLSSTDERLLRTFLPPERVTVIPSSIGGVATEPSTGSPGAPQVLFVGGIDPFRKGIDVLLEAVPLVRRRAPATRFVFTGGPNVQDTVRSAALDPAHVSAPGWFEEARKADLLAATDVLVLPSTEEGMPYVIVEALGAGVPVVATGVGAIGDVVTDGRNGFLVPPDDAHVLADRIARLVSDRELRARLGLAAREGVRNGYTHEHSHAAIRRLYENLTGTRDPRAAPAEAS